MTFQTLGKALGSLTAFTAMCMGVRHYNLINQPEYEKADPSNSHSMRRDLLEGDGPFVFDGSEETHVRYRGSTPDHSKDGCCYHTLEGYNGEVRSIYVSLGASNGVKRTVDCGWVTEWAMGVFANDSLTKGAKIGTPYYDAEVYTRKGDDFESIGRLGTLTEKQKSGISEFRGCGSYEFPDAEDGRRRGSLIANPGALDACEEFTIWKIRETLKKVLALEELERETEL